jgi:hypothetical protein
MSQRPQKHLFPLVPRLRAGPRRPSVPPRTPPQVRLVDPPKRGAEALRWRRRAADAMVIAAIAAAVMVAVHHIVLLIGPAQYDLANMDTWFQADTPRVFQNVTSRWSNHYRTSAHPLFSIIQFMADRVVMRISGAPQAVAIPWLVAIEAAVWATSLFLLLRTVGLKRLDAAVFTAMASTTAASMFWLPILETHTLASITLIWVLALAARLAKLGARDRELVFANLASMSMTIPHWIAGILVTFAHRHWRRALQLVANALVVAIALWTVQKLMMPSAGFFLGERGDFKYFSAPTPARVVQGVANFVSNPIVLPRVTRDGATSDLTVQHAGPRSASPLGQVGLVAWLVLLVLAARSVRHAPLRPRFTWVLVGTTVSLFALYLLYGDEAFLHSLAWLPLLIVFAGISALGPLRVPALGFAALVAVCAAWSNARELDRSIGFVLERMTERDQVKRQMALRPHDPWPRGVGHVILATPGSPDTLKAYLEPGGGFSPSHRSFGVSIWARTSRGAPLTSGSIPLGRVRQAFVPAADGPTPAVTTETPYYRVTWTPLGPGGWRGDVTPLVDARVPIEVVIRSVGPAGGPIQRLATRGSRLWIDRRWSITASGPGLSDADATTAVDGPATSNWMLGTEDDRAWIDHASTQRTLDSPTGWGFARLRLRGPSTLVLTDEGTADASWRPVPTPRLDLVLEGIDDRFGRCLLAQAHHLAMGLTPDGARPGDPLHYGFTWARDEAYVVVALARAGRIEAARGLVQDFVNRDYFGGFGAEADAPGLGIWAMAEVARRVNDPGFERALWPAVERKAQAIENFLAARDTIWASAQGPVLNDNRLDWQQSLLTEPSRDGLVIGRMDRQRPVLYVSAMSYRGLVDAAALARRQGRPDLAARWHERALALARAWRTRIAASADDNDRTYASALWPSAVAIGDEPRLEVLLADRWRRKRDANGGFVKHPAYTYFDLAEAHQWLMLDREDRVWDTLNWFYDHQSSPGLYTWWEGTREEHESGAWRNVRGWIAPESVTPHYWTAAEMLLLQLDMLAYERIADGRGTLVIGGGVPRTWLARPFRIAGLSLASGRVDWWWDGAVVHVRRAGDDAIELGRAFPAGTVVRLEPPVSDPSAAVVSRRR